MTQRLPQRTMDSTRPSPGMVSPRAAILMPSGLRERRCRPGHRQPSSRVSSPAWFPAPPPGAAAARSQRRKGLHSPGRPNSQPGVQPATGRMAWECFRRWSANRTRMPSFERLRSCRSIVLRTFAARALLSAQLSTRPSSLANWGQFRPPVHPSPKLATSAARPAKRGVRDRQMAPAPPILRRDRLSGNSAGSRAAPAAGRQPHSPTRSQRYSARGLAWRDPAFGEPMMFL